MRVDLHMHTGYSADAQYPQSIDDKIHACEQAGLDIIGITDHLDFLRSGGTRDNRDPEACAREVWEKRRPAENGGIEVLAGMEIGQLHATPDADDFVRTHPFDMVIGSLHAMPNDLDIYFHDFPNMDCDKFLHEYFDQLLLMEAHGGFDVLAHIDYPLRVMKHGDYIPSFDNYMDRVQQVLRSCIDHGYALELNAAGLAEKGRSTAEYSVRIQAHGRRAHLDRFGFAYAGHCGTRRRRLREECTRRRLYPRYRVPRAQTGADRTEINVEAEITCFLEESRKLHTRIRPFVPVQRST